LDYLDEPFGDSSAIAVNILSKLTKQHISVSLSGDGADEMFAGYNKHMAEYKVRDPGILEQIVKGINPLLEKLPQSRDNKFANLTRQMSRYAQGAKLNHKQRYWRWASFLNEEEANYLLIETQQERTQRLSDDGYQYKKRKDNILKYITRTGDLNDVLFTDMHLVLQNDMLTKVDMMSMSHSLEVRTPFLDHHVVNFAFSLPAAYKINSHMRKKILTEAFEYYLPPELLNRPKQGFEVPLLKWFRKELRSLITDDLLHEDFIKEQGLFNPKSINGLVAKLFSKNPGDSHATIWALIVFQYWWKKYMNN
jgi:asparagine synthase (glutamine-hydrolysing)